MSLKKTCICDTDFCNAFAADPHGISCYTGDYEIGQIVHSIETATCYTSKCMEIKYEGKQN